MNETQLPPEPSGDLPLGHSEASPPQIPGIPSRERAASLDEVSIAKAWAEAEQLTRNLTPEQLAEDAAFREHGRNQRFRQHFENIAVGSLYVAAIAIAVVGGVWLWHMAAPVPRRWLGKDDVSHLQSIMTAGLLVGVIGNHFKKRLN